MGKRLEGSLVSVVHSLIMSGHLQWQRVGSIENVFVLHCTLCVVYIDHFGTQILIPIDSNLWCYDERIIRMCSSARHQVNLASRNVF